MSGGKIKVFTWITLFIYQVCSVHLTTVRQVSVKIFTKSESKYRGCTFPHHLVLKVKRGNLTFSFELHKNDDIENNVPMYISKRSKDGGFRVEKSKSLLYDFAAYQNGLHGTSALVKCSQHGLFLYDVAGELTIQGEGYQISRSHNIPSSPDRFSQIKENELYYLIPSSHNVRLSAHGQVFQEVSRTPRDAVDEFYIDVFVMVDFAIYSRWLIQSNGNDEIALANIRRYFAHVINGVNLRYKNIKGVGFRINVRLIGYVVAQTAAASPWTELTKTLRHGRLHVNADDVLEAVKKWINSLKNMPDHDHAMLYTGYDLYGEDSGFSSNYTTGLAFIGTMCQGNGRSVSVVEDHGGFQSVGTAAHELGHSLGAEHDGLNNSCTPADRYIMAGESSNETSDNKYNPWRFSPCSVDYFKKYINSVINNVKESTCFRSKLTPVGVPNITGEMAGQLLGPDEQCRHIYGMSSYLCRGENFGEATDICRAMFCRNPKTTNKCVLHVAARGTSCGNKRWCVEGQCVGHIHAPRRPRGCPFGDQTGVISNGKTCQQIVSQTSGYCYVKDFRTRCCASCAFVHTGVYACEYGDRVLDCQEKFCGKKFKDGTLYDSDCCGTCNYAPPTTPRDTSVTTALPSNCRDLPEIDSIPCSDYVRSAGKSTCYRVDVYNTCCRTCNDVKENSNPNCPWGDRDPHYCSQMTGNLVSTCPRDIRGICCETCNAIDRERKSLAIISTTSFSPLNSTADSITTHLNIFNILFNAIVCVCILLS